MAVLYGITGTDNQIAAVALSQIGNEGGELYWSWYGFKSHVDWCACFVSWCANECGYIDDGVFPKFASCTRGRAWFMARDQWLYGGETPEPGMLIFFDWNDPINGQDGLPEHVAIVTAVEGGNILIVEGNSADCCKESSYAISDSVILGYGIIST